MECPDANELQELMSGQLAGARRAQVTKHLDRCGECREVVASLARAAAGEQEERARSAARGDMGLEQTQAVAAMGTATTVDSGSSVTSTRGEQLATGAKLGRYVIAARLGAGAMGVVYSAKDPELGREVAIKLLKRPEPMLRERLSREARAMAQVNHPNVVAVYDVGTVDEQVYVAMELVRGQTLRQWQSEKRRGVSEIVEMYAAAGRGLAAAHAAGVVHRDFKPDNVLIGEDGRPRVTDFGLAGALIRGGGEVKGSKGQWSGTRTKVARAERERGNGNGDERKREKASDEISLVALDSSAATLKPTERGVVVGFEETLAASPSPTPRAGKISIALHETMEGSESDSASLFSDVTLTQTGVLLGTPVYMSPEQFESGNVDPRSDQWAFCVSLHEALFGARPFLGPSWRELQERVTSGAIAPVGPSKISPALRRIVHRGLSVRPGDRHATMDELIAELGRDRGRPHRRVALAAGLVAAAFAVGVGADALLRARAEEATTVSFRATGGQLDRSVALRYESFVALADASYSVPVMHQVLGHKDQADFGFGEQGEDIENLSRVHDSLSSADWISWAKRSSRATIAVGDYKGRLLFTSADPERWGADLLVLSAASAAYAAVRTGAEPAGSPEEAEAASRRSGGAMVARYDDARVAAAQLYGRAVPEGLAVIFARALVVGGVPLGLFIQAIDGRQLLDDVSLGDDLLLSLVAPDGSAVGAAPRAAMGAVGAISAAAPEAGDAPSAAAASAISELRAGGHLYLAQARPLLGLDGKSPIATLVLARRIDPGLSGLFAGARTAFALAALLLSGLALLSFLRARALALVRR